MIRTDEHRPSAIDPSAYEYVGQEMVKIEDFGDCAYLQSERERIRLHMERTGGRYSGHEHGGSCMVCGNVNAIYTILYYHAATNTYVRMGADCARKCDMGGDFDSSAFRAAIAEARLRHAGKAKAQALLADAGHLGAWEIYTEFRMYTDPAPRQGWYRDTTTGQMLKADGSPLTYPEAERAWAELRAFRMAHREEETIQDIVGKLVKFGSISEKAMAYIGTCLQRIADRPQREAQQEAERAAAQDCPAGRLRIAGTVLTVKVDEDAQFGPTTRMLVKADAGYKVWGSRPSGSGAERGDRIEFTATFTPSDRDTKFGFFKRPYGAVVTRPEAAAEPVGVQG